MSDGKIEVSISSDDERVMVIKQRLNEALTAALDECKLEGELRHMMTALAVTSFLWECGQRSEQIPPVAIGALMNMAVDAGMAERIGMHQMAGPEDTIQ